MEPISPYLYLVECQDEHNVSKTPVVNKDSLHVEIENCGRYDQRIIMGEVMDWKASDVGVERL